MSSQISLGASGSTREAAPEVTGSGSAQNGSRDQTQQKCRRCSAYNLDCDYLRPSCSPCIAASFTCQYEERRGGEQLEQEVQDAGALLGDFQFLLSRIRNGSEEEARNIFDRLRSSTDLHDILSQMGYNGGNSNGGNSNGGNSNGGNSNNTSGFSSENTPSRGEPGSSPNPQRDPSR